ncbi:MAG: hypothetical protein OXP71_10340 [Candidatus Poribacteria bacterium]|nr:hypothetical protein [Candidatus Poribacteria bacterium]
MHGVSTPNPHQDEIVRQEYQDFERHFQETQETLAFYTQKLEDFGVDGENVIEVVEQIQADLAAMSPDEILEVVSDLKAFYSQYGLDTSPLN